MTFTPYAGGSRQQGFTLIELLIATLVFSVVLIIIMTGIIQFTRQYYKGVISGNTQNTARAIMDDISRAVQYNSGGFTPIGAGTDKGYCVGGAKRYSYVINQQVEDSPASNSNLHQGSHGLVSDEVVGCGLGTAPLSVSSLTSLPSSLSSPEELLGPHMRLSRLDITFDQPTHLVSIDVRVIYGDDDLLTDTSSTGIATATCNSNAGSQFCAVAELHTSVQERVQ